MASQRDVKNRIDSVKNIRKITRAMEMVAAARLRRAEQRIEALRPYAGAIRRMTRQAAEAAGTEVGSLPILKEHESDRHRRDPARHRRPRPRRRVQLADHARRHARRARARGRGPQASSSTPPGRRGVSSLTFRGRDVAGGYTGFTERPPYADAREIAEDLIAAYVDGEVDRVEIFYNGYISPLTQEVRSETLLPLQEATVLESDEDDEDEKDGDDRDSGGEDGGKHALVEYEPDPEEILQRLVPDYVEISIYRALLESTASEHGARMTAMRSASENAGEVIDDLTLEMNRARQAEITQEIMEVVAGAEALT